MKYFNPDSIRKIQLFKTPAGFRYGLVEDLFFDAVFEKLVSAFPAVNQFRFVDKPSGGGRKRFYVGPVYDANKQQGCICHFDRLDPLWREVVLESGSAELIDLFRQACGLKFNTISSFGFTYGKAGCVQEPHLDGAVRADRGEIFSNFATLIYFNRQPHGTSGTCVYDLDRKTILYQVKNMRNSLFFFEQHFF